MFRWPLLLVFLLGSLESTQAVAQPSDPAYQLVWSDEFDGTTLDLGKWEPQIGTGCPSLCGWGNNELQYYRAENATVSGGLLTISAKEEAFGGKAYTSARLRTKDLGDWRYGRFEMRAKMPIGRGIWPAFWMLPTDEVYGGWPFSGEIDILEYLGQDPSRIFGTLHYGGPFSTFVSTATTLSSGTFHDGFHEFALEWDPHEIRWYLDGQLYACNSHWFSANGEYPAPFDQRFHLLLNMAVGGNLPGSPDASTVFPQELVVDWVRVWQKPAPPARLELLFDGMDHANPFGNGWFAANGGGGGGIGANTVDLPPEGGCRASLESGWGGPAGFIGVFGRTFPLDLTDMTHFEMWLHPDPDQTYTLEINLQEDDNGDDLIPSSPDGQDDEFQYELQVSPTGPGAIAGGGWQKISIPLVDFHDDNSFHWGGNGIFDPYPVSSGGNGRLVSVVIAVISPNGGSQTFRTDAWLFRNADAVVAAGDGSALPGPNWLDPAVPNPFGAVTNLSFRLPAEGPYRAIVFDVRGRRVRDFGPAWGGAGVQVLSWDGRTDQGTRAPSGMYFVRVRQGGREQTRKIVLRR